MALSIHAEREGPQADSDRKSTINTTFGSMFDPWAQEKGEKG
ncbi:hypothetical protein OU5_1901 [Pseudomonas mandelii JR-1]|uniref:Uncharacterized protein n=1 Tax=Pseudomonas mandelii JR-1 TaxID=1147786 RepID=A0A024E8R9_9PSED|nr:hypothetical protein OU5_1901 [Pseudomonas mandelii JR-1]